MPTPRLSDLTVVSHLGEGGTATVSEVSSAQNIQNAALKQQLNNIHASKDEFRDLILRENKLIGQHNYPGLVRLHSVSTNEDPFLLMELCHGSTLDKLDRVDDPIEALNLISAIAVNLEYLRLHGLIHCDLKPHNIFLPGDYSTSKNNLFYLKISDFSLGRQISEKDNARAGLGTVGYMPPETTNSQTTSHQSDLFALGVIAYQLMTGCHPFAENETDPVKINARAQEDTPVDITRYRSDIPDAVISLINKLLSKYPDARPETAWQVCLELEMAGASYPFRRALHPRYFFTGTNLVQYAENSSWLNLNDKQAQQLKDYCGTDQNAFKFLVTANFRNKRLFHDGSQFACDGDLYWPSALRRKLLSAFSKLSIAEKRNMINRAVSSRAQNSDSQVVKINNSDLSPASFNDLILNLLKPATIKRLAEKMALKALKNEDHLAAACLFTLSGNLSKAEESTFLAANQLINDHHPEDAVLILKQTLELAALRDELANVKQLLMLLGDTYKSIGEIEKAQTVYADLLQIYKDLPADKLLAETYKDIGEINRIKKNFESGIVNLNNALKIYEKLGDELELSRTYNNIGNVYFTTSDFKSALLNYRRALTIKRRINDEHDLGQTLNNIGTVFGSRGNHTRAKLFFGFSLDLNKKLGRKVEIARALNNLGYTYYYCGELDKATESLMEAFKINKGIGTNNELLFNYDNLTSVMMISGRLEQTAEHLCEARNLAEQLADNAHVASFSLSLSSVYRRMGKFSLAQQAIESARLIIESFDDADLKIRLEIEQAETSFDLGHTQLGYDKALGALRMAKEADNMPAVLNSLLLLTKISCDEKHFQQARKIVSEMKLNREELTIFFNRLAHENALDNDEHTKSAIETNIISLEKIKADIELPRYCNIAAESMRQQGNTELAMSLAERALSHAQRSSQRPEIVRAYAILGRLHNDQNDYEESYSLFRKALKNFKEIISEVDNPVDRQAYQSDKTIQALIADVKQLANLMNQK